MALTTASERRRKIWGWGYEGDGLSPAELDGLAAIFAKRFGLDPPRPLAPPSLDELRLAPPRVSPPGSLAAISSTEVADRAEHTYGKSFRDLVRGLRRDYTPAPDLVFYPRSEAEVAAVLEWCASERVAAIPYGGGSSVVGGVEPAVGDAYRGAASVDLRRLDKVLEVDRASRAARIQAGVLGPALEDQLRPQGLTLRHFPQSFEVSSLGGWIATRSGGHFATLYTHIDEFVEALRVVTPGGLLETRRLPGSGAGPSPDRLLCGSEGVLGVITEAWMRLQDRPRFRASATVSFTEFERAVEACRLLSQSGLHPANCRLLDPLEALLSGSGDGSSALLIVAFESADHELGPWLARALEICRGFGGQVAEGEGGGGAAETWRSAFLRGGHLHDALARLGMVNETFETAITWDRFERFHERVRGGASKAVADACGQGFVSCRFTHVYPDGPAPYYTVVAPGRAGAELEQWQAVKRAASEAILAEGGTITHHHAVGRDHRPWYDRERPELFGKALRAAKAALDPAGIMNPGVLLDPAPA
ncbi:MAG TPA: FAD-binding oxidoreductase [Candidatus Acidoferrales bacterium]|nr:FAD-binding oxidoreductase [Candidatus Acidoferrales bacterium]